MRLFSQHKNSNPLAGNLTKQVIYVFFLNYQESYYHGYLNVAHMLLKMFVQNSFFI